MSCFFPIFSNYQVVPGSHKLDRLDHARHTESGQMEANPDKVKHAIKSLGKVYLEMEAGKISTISYY